MADTWGGQLTRGGTADSGGEGKAQGISSNKCAALHLIRDRKQVAGFLIKIVMIKEEGNLCDRKSP